MTTQAQQTLSLDADERERNRVTPRQVSVIVAMLDDIVERLPDAEDGTKWCKYLTGWTDREATAVLNEKYGWTLMPHHISNIRQSEYGQVRRGASKSAEPGDDDAQNKRIVALESDMARLRERVEAALRNLDSRIIDVASDLGAVKIALQVGVMKG